ncbi:MATE family efflux transporter [Clostridium beijerinckii]|jgi:putative efflux protein, MATE family|uniref:MATE family efflux transporter n=3 Tax=Clostridium beijerinckii TaxID=1520 RepID=A0AAE2V242_CLOBE|nr:MATE family efflux transporter [Clostridium beijerinckii]AIU04402.1 MATE efflux family protein [Clostridium beijerinckii ATCC 35702]ABR34932.1 MATE efflux family protein [Clostridium beijerinckii NCIMB 8052]MBF7810432.1 MATE family efflux transporter [Clostridium beijerinckii]NRT68719.1 putative MATE family efflux protein [Clostridium beijerinckii]NRU48303.1 putative MATE family efflux protein [Clostridium beijerinckii]
MFKLHIKQDGEEKTTMEKNKITDLTTGNPGKQIFYFALPIFLGSVFQQMYNLADTVIVGHTLGENALAAIGATTPLFGLIVGMAVGINNGFAIVIARYFGAKEMDNMRQAVAMTVILDLIISIVFTAVGVGTIMYLLKFLNTPEEIINDAYGYIVIILMFMIVTIMYNMIAGVLRALGDSRSPLIYLIYASILNVVLVFTFILVFKWGVRGSAYATVISQIVAVILGFNHIIKKCPELKLSKGDFKYDGTMVMELITSGLSMGFMLSLVSIGSVALQGAINSFGKEIITAHMAARKVSEIYMMPLGTLATASATFVSQNYGAKKYDRINIGLKKTVIMGAIWSTIVVITAFAFGTYIIKFLTGSNDTLIIDTAVKYLRINTPFYYVLATLLIYRSTLQGIGKKFTPLVSSSIELFGKFAVVGFLAPSMGYLGVCISEPIIWITCAIFVLIVFYSDKNFRVEAKQEKN